eukprot:8084149-Lingulodinium_polyedra.AAC.1
MSSAHLGRRQVAEAVNAERRWGLPDRLSGTPLSRQPGCAGAVHAARAVARLSTRAPPKKHNSNPSTSTA